MICDSCGCSESRPCIEPDLNAACTWVRPGLCSSCAFDQVVEGETLELPAPAERFPGFHPRQVA